MIRTRASTRLCNEIRFKDHESGKKLVCLTNNFVLTVLPITKFYRLGWQIQ